MYELVPADLEVPLGAEFKLRRSFAYTVVAPDPCAPAIPMQRTSAGMSLWGAGGSVDPHDRVKCHCHFPPRALNDPPLFAGGRLAHVPSRRCDRLHGSRDSP